MDSVTRSLYRPYFISSQTKISIVCVYCVDNSLLTRHRIYIFYIVINNDFKIYSALIVFLSPEINGT